MEKPPLTNNIPGGYSVNELVCLPSREAIPVSIGISRMFIENASVLIIVNLIPVLLPVKNIRYIFQHLICLFFFQRTGVNMKFSFNLIFWSIFYFPERLWMCKTIQA